VQETISERQRNVGKPVLTRAVAPPVSRETRPLTPDHEASEIITAVRKLANRQERFWALSPHKISAGAHSISSGGCVYQQPCKGNPAAVRPLNAWLDDEQLRKVAAENNISETAFSDPEPTITTSGGSPPRVRQDSAAMRPELSSKAAVLTMPGDTG